jgi:hypothetical protein
MRPRCAWQRVNAGERDLENRKMSIVALVTGGNRGIGSGPAGGFFRDGHPLRW